MATPNVPADMAQFFDFGEAAMPDATGDAGANASIAPKKLTGCPAHGDAAVDGCICHGFVEDFELPEDLRERQAPVTEWNPDFSSWIPRYHKPAHPCDYCRSRSLECFIYNAGGDKKGGCSPCNALFRPCSFSEPDKMTMQKSKTALDTLDIVTEDAERCFGGLTGKKPMRSLGHVGPLEDDDKAPKRGAAAARFPRAAVKVLKDWMIAHIDHPYPTDEEKEMLKLETGLTISQISNWMANTRRRQKARPKRSASPSIRPSTGAIDIPAGRTWDDLNPFERWKHSPPENEPAPMTAIAKAVEDFDLPEPSSLSSSYNGRKGNSNGSSGSFSVFRAPSTTSLETGFTNMSSGSAQSHGSAWSYGSRNSLGSLNSLNSKKERRRRRRMPTRAPKLDLESAPRLFQCTFCTDRFKNKYDWSRHEKSLHLSLEKWICAPLGEVITCSSSGQRKCVYCDEIEPSKEHLATHNHSACEEKGLEARTFYRKDHLRQHLRLMHGCKMTASMESWKSEAQFIKSRCGFCGMNFDKWQDRTDHLAKEFRNGAQMKDWKGCRGLDAHVAAHVTNAMPPYLIANEAKSPFPFSATNSASMKHHNLYLVQNDLEYLLPTDKTSPTGVFIPHHMGDVGINSSSSVSPTNVPFNSPQDNISSANSPHPNPNATCWEILTLRLGRFARQHIEKNGTNSVTDDMLQTEARHILYDCDDPWNQTAADNPEWLSLFKKAHGIDDKGPWPEVLSQHEILEDLGLQPSAKLDKSFNLNNFQCVTKSFGTSAAEALAYECSLSGTMNLTKAVNQLGGASTPFTLPELGSSTNSGASNFLTMSSFDLPGLDAPISELTCTTPGGICIGENGEIGFAVENGTCSRSKPTYQDYFLPNTTSESTSCHLASVKEQACTAAGDPIFPTIQETPCTTAGEPLQDHFSFANWDLPQGFDLTTTSAGLSQSLPVTTGVSTSSADVIQGNMSNPQIMRWDDGELGFGLEDMDLDMDMNNLIMNTNINQQT